MAKKKRKVVEVDIDYDKIGKPEFDIDAPATEFPCFICANDVGTEHFCYGCRVFICDLCESVHRTTGEDLIGKHKAEDHVTKEYLIFLVNRKG